MAGSGVIGPAAGHRVILPSFLYSLRNVERRPVLCSFKRIEGGLSKKSVIPAGHIHVAPG